MLNWAASLFAPPVSRSSQCCPNADSLGDPTYSVNCEDDYEIVGGEWVPVRKECAWIYPCFPASATVSTSDRGTITMAQLRPGDRVLAVGRDGRPAFEVCVAAVGSRALLP